MFKITFLKLQSTIQDLSANIKNCKFISLQFPVLYSTQEFLIDPKCLDQSTFKKDIRNR